MERIVGGIANWTFPEVDVVVAIGSGGVVPGALVAQHLRKDLAVLWVNYRDAHNQPRHAEPRLLAAVPELRAGTRVLLVDDVCVSGRTLATARAALEAGGLTTHAFVLKGDVPFALIRDVPGCVAWPWSGPD